MKINISKYRSLPGTRLGKIAAIAALMVGLFTPQARAINLQQWSSSLLAQLKGNSAVGGILAEFTRISQSFQDELKNMTSVTDEAIAQIRGELGQLDPTTAKTEIEERVGADSPIGQTLNQGKAAAATSALAADKVLNKEAQRFDKEKLAGLLTTTEESAQFANNTESIGTQAQSAISSQDVLKALAAQNNHRAKIEAAQVQMSMSVASDLQEIKTQMAASNQSMSEMLKYQQGERQRQLLTENEQTQASLREQFNNMTQTGL
jgi:hypothetical protein